MATCEPRIGEPGNRSAVVAMAIRSLPPMDLRAGIWESDHVIDRASMRFSLAHRPFELGSRSGRTHRCLSANGHGASLSLAWNHGGSSFSGF
jgi:hypothetical protein